MNNDLVEKGRVFEAVNSEGETIECEVIMYYYCYGNKKDYIFYTDNKYDEDGSLNLFASRYLGEGNGQMILEEITDENEWLFLDEALEKAKEGLEENE